DGLGQGRHLALGLDGDLLGQVAAGHGCGHLGDVSHLAGEVAGHEVDVVGQVLPGPRYTPHLGLAAELSLRAHLACDSGDLVGERRQLVDHDVDGVLQFEDLALDVDGDLLGEIAARYRGRDLGDVAHLGGQVGRHVVHRVGEVLPRAGD